MYQQMLPRLDSFGIGRQFPASFWEGGRNAELNFTADVRQHLERTVAHVRVVSCFRVFLSLSALSIRWFDRMKK